MISFAAAFAIALSICSPVASVHAMQTTTPGHAHWFTPEISTVVTMKGNLVRVEYIHYAKHISAVRTLKPTQGYKLMGVKWLVQEGFVINSGSIPAYLNKNDTLDDIIVSTETWDAMTTCSLTTKADLFGANGITSTATYGNYDYVNVIDFGPLDYANAIAVTSIWYDRSTKSILEYDMRFNTAFQWSTSGAASKMDVQNIATHELGHAVGLSDLYNSTFSAMTMYGYADYGETNKQTLEPPDIAGLQKMYGI
jgi:hypothetical protein